MKSGYPQKVKSKLHFIPNPPSDAPTLDPNIKAKYLKMINLQLEMCSHFDLLHQSLVVEVSVHNLAAVSLISLIHLIIA